METKKQESVLLNATKVVWNDPFARIAIFVVGGFGFLLLAGAFFKVGAFTMNEYKNFRAAQKRP